MSGLLQECEECNERFMTVVMKAKPHYDERENKNVISIGVDAKRAGYCPFCGKEL